MYGVLFNLIREDKRIRRHHLHSVKIGDYLIPDNARLVSHAYLDPYSHIVLNSIAIHQTIGVLPDYMDSYTWIVCKFAVHYPHFVVFLRPDKDTSLQVIMDLAFFDGGIAFLNNNSYRLMWLVSLNLYLVHNELSALVHYYRWKDIIAVIYYKA